MAVYSDADTAPIKFILKTLLWSGGNGRGEGDGGRGGGGVEIKFDDAMDAKAMPPRPLTAA